MSFFGGNPFGTQVGQLIEQATDGTLASENWALNMEICDIINETDDGPKDAIKAIRKRLTTAVGKNYTVVMYTLTVLETCVKNCGKRFHIQVANKDFLHELIKIIGPRNDPPQIVQEKVLSLIQTWADAFKGSPELKEVEKIYLDLKGKGIEFPMTDLDNLAPIHTPARSMPELDPAVQGSQPIQRTGSARAQQYMTGQEGQVAPVMQQQQQPPQQPPPQGSPTHQMLPPVQQAPTGPVALTPEQMAKLRSELDTVQGNVRVMGEMLTEMTPGQEQASDLELLQELNRTCRQMQQRIVELVERVANEEVTEELLRVNDDLNNAFLRYERFERYRTGQTGPTPAADPVPAAVTPVPQPTPAQLAAAAPPAYVPPPVEPAREAIGNLIDLGDSGGPATQPPPPTQPTTLQQSTHNPFAPVSASDISVQLAGMNVGNTSVSSTLGQLNTTTATNSKPDDEFDMFAQSRQSFDQSKEQQLSGAAGTAYANQQPDQFPGTLGVAVNAKNTGNPYGNNLLDKKTEYDEMESWLVKEKQNEHGAGAQANKDETSMTSSEFDRFLADRAAAMDDQPDRRPEDVRSNNTRGGRQMKKQDETENALFAL